MSSSKPSRTRRLADLDPGAQDIERQIRRVWSVYREHPAAHAHSAALLERLTEISRDIRRLPVAYDEWQVVYEMPGTEKRTWFFLGSPPTRASSVAPCDPGLATFVHDDENPDPVADRGTAPQAIREALANMVRLQAANPMLPRGTAVGADGITRTFKSAPARDRSGR